MMTDNLYPWVYTLDFRLVSPVLVLLPPGLTLKKEHERLGLLQIFNAMHNGLKNESEYNTGYQYVSLSVKLDLDTAEPIGPLRYAFRLNREATPEQLTMTARGLSAHLTAIMWVNGHQYGVIPPL